MASRIRQFLILLSLASLARPAFPQDAGPLRKEIAAAHVVSAAAARKDGLWEEARDDYVFALDLDESSEAAKQGRDELASERVLVWSDAIHKKYVAWKGKRDKAGKEEAKKLAGLLKAWPADRADEGQDLARLAVRLDPENKEARTFQGEAFVKGTGWMPKEDADQVSKGNRRWGKEWVPAKSVEGQKPAWDSAWEVRGPNFAVRCNAGEAEGKSTLAWAEEVLRAFRREFNGMLPVRVPAEGMSIFHFKDRADLDEHIRTAHGDRPGPKKAPGFFTSEDKVGHFFPVSLAGSDQTLEDIIRHETTHQVAYYAMPAAQGNPTERPHFWAWEGLASYFETLQVRDGKLLLGNPAHVRIKLCRDLVAKNQHVPWKDFVQGAQAQMSGRYPQAATMLAFFMNAKMGAYREKLVEYLKVVHEAKADAGSFDTAFGAAPESFEAEWIAWVKALK